MYVQLGYAEKRPAHDYSEHEGGDILQEIMQKIVDAEQQALSMRSDAQQASKNAQAEALRQGKELIERARHEAAEEARKVVAAAEAQAAALQKEAAAKAQEKAALLKEQGQKKAQAAARFVMERIVDSV